MPWDCGGLFSCCRSNVEDVRELNFNHNSLKEVPTSVFAHERTLEELNLEANRIVDLPRALFHCHGLKVLNLSDNDIKVMPPAIASLINLEHLNLSKNSLTDIPDNIKCCKQLIYVNASVNPLDKLPEGFTQLIALEELYLNDTFLEFLPANFGRLSKLRILDLRENHLNTLPKSIARLSNLQILDIGRNEFSDLPEVVGNLPELRDLWADSNKIRSIPSFIGNLPKIVNLDASNNNIQWVAPEIERCISLSYLILSGNELASLPEEIGNLKGLTMLKVDENDIETLPRSIGKLSNLEELVISQNVIESLPPTIGLLRKVASINADDNRLSELPSELCSCASLRILSVRNNTLGVMPAEIGHLTGIRVINVADNMLQNLPVSILNLTNLNALWLSINQSTPLTTLQQEIDPKTGLTVCVNFMFPQGEQERNRKRQDFADKKPVSVERPSRPHIRFADSTDLRNTSRLTRAPTPYPKELRSMAKHARILTTKPMLEQPESDEEVPLLGDSRNAVLDASDRNSGIRTAMVKKPMSAPEMVTATDQPQANYEGYVLGNVNDPGVLPLVEDIYKSGLPRPPADDQYMGLPRPEHYGSGENASMTASTGIATASALGISAATLQATRSDVGFLKPQEANRSEEGFGGNGIDSPVVTATLSTPEASSVRYSCPLANQSLNPGSFENIASEVDLPNDAGFNGNISSNGDPNFLNGVDPAGYTLPAQAKVPPPYHIAAIHSKQAAYFMNPSNGQNIIESSVAEPTDFPASPPSPGNTASSEVPRSLTPIDAGLVDEEGNAILDGRTAGQPPPASETMEDLQLDLSGVTQPEVDKLPRSPAAKCNIPVLRGKDSGTTGIPKPNCNLADEFLPDKNILKVSPQRPRESISKIPSFSSKEPKLPVVKKPSGIASGSSSTKLLQPGFHTASQLPLPKSPTVGPSHENEASEDIASVGLPTNGNREETDDVDGSGVGNGNGVDTERSPSEMNVTASGFKSRIPARVSPVKGSTTPNSPTSPTWVFGQHKNPTVFPLILVKNPGLGFSICGGTATPEKPDAQGIFISKVQPTGPAGGALMTGDKILEVDGIDFSKLEHDQAVGILKQTKNTVHMMISRQK